MGYENLARCKTFGVTIPAGVDRVRHSKTKSKICIPLPSFLDQYLLGPLYLLLDRHQVKGDNNAVIGYQYLNEIYEKMQHVMIRRLKRNVMQQLPKRTDKNLLVPMTGPQRELHESYKADVAKLVAKWKRFHFFKRV